MNTRLLQTPWILALGVAALAWLLYARTLSADFVWDARAQILIDHFIHEPRNLPDVLTGRVLSRDVLDNDRPTNLLSLMVDSACWGKNPAGYHATSVTLHAAACGLLVLLLLRLMGGLSAEGNVAAALAALVYAVHPLNCEPVSEVSYREDLLVTVAILLALWAATGFMRQPGKTRNFLFAAACCAALLAGIGAKENGVAGPVALAGYWFLWRRNEPKRPWLALMLAAFGLVAGFTAARFALAPDPARCVIFAKSAPRLGGTLWNTMLIQPRIWAMELRQIVWPTGLCADYGPYSLRDSSFGPSLAAVLLVAAGQIWLAWRNRLCALGGLLFWAALAPVSNLVPIYRPIADRFLYLPLIGGAMILAEALRRVPAGWPRRAAYAAVGLWVVIAAMATLQREAVWHNSLTLWQTTIAENPYSLSAADNLGWALLDENRAPEAEAAFRRALGLTGAGEPDALGGLALALEAQGQTPAADAAFLNAAALDPRLWHPEELVRALIDNEEVAGKLELLARRNRKP